VSFPSGAQAENKPHGAGRKVSLIRVRNDGWIEQGSGFQRVFGEEIGPDQESPLFGHFLMLQHQVANLFETFQKELANVLVSLREFSGDFVQERADSVFRERHDPPDDPARPLRIPRIEGPQKNA